MFEFFYFLFLVILIIWCILNCKRDTSKKKIYLLKPLFLLFFANDLPEKYYLVFLGLLIVLGFVCFIFFSVRFKDKVIDKFTEITGKVIFDSEALYSWKDTHSSLLLSLSSKYYYFFQFLFTTSCDTVTEPKALALLNLSSHLIVDFKVKI